MLEAEYSEKAKQRFIWIAIGVVLLSAVSWFAWRRHKRNRARHRTSITKPVTTISPSSTIPQPLTPAPRGLALELWVKSPEGIAAKILPRLIPPGTPAAMVPTFATVLKNGLPPESASDIDQLDLTKPLGYAVLEPDPAVPPPPDGGARFVIAASV